MHLATDFENDSLHEGKPGEKHFAVVVVADATSMERHMTSINQNVQKNEFISQHCFPLLREITCPTMNGA